MGQTQKVVWLPSQQHQARVPQLLLSPLSPPLANQPRAEASPRSLLQLLMPLLMVRPLQGQALVKEQEYLVLQWLKDSRWWHLTSNFKRPLLLAFTSHSSTSVFRALYNVMLHDFDNFLEINVPVVSWLKHYWCCSHSVIYCICSTFQ